MKRTGELLRKAREEKGLSVHEVSMFLKINTRILQAIEEGNQANLPAKTFLRGFVQSYAKFLKMDAQEVLQVFSEEMSPHPVSAPIQTGESPPLPSSSVSSDGPKLEVVSQPMTSDYLADDGISKAEGDPLKNSVLAKASQPPDTLRIRTIAISMTSLLLVFIIYFANSIIKKYQREAELTPDMAVSLPVGTPTVPIEMAPTANAHEVAPTPTSNNALTEPSAKNNDSADQTSTPTPAPQVASKPAVAPSPPPVPAAPKPAVVPPPTPTSPATIGITAAGTSRASTVPSTAETTTPKPAEGKLVEVIVEARQNVEIEYSSARSRPQRLSLRGDQIHTFKSRSGVRLKISNGGAVNVIVNGRDLGVPGVVGQPVQLSYD